jgi:hypothetical protein
MASADYLVEERDRSGGVGANFLVEWTSKEAVSQPIIEAVMIGNGVSFVSRGSRLDCEE